MLGEVCQPTGPGPEFFHKFMMNASVEMSKSNRRKQSKPNRLLAEEGNASSPKLQLESTLQSLSGAMLQMQGAAESMETEKEEKNPMDLSTRGTQSPASSAAVGLTYSQPVEAIASAELEIVNFPCHTCGEIFSSRSLQEQHNSERHSSELPKVSSSSPSTVFPTAYHQLATELGLGPLPSGPSPSSTKTSDKPRNSGSLSSTSIGVPSLATSGVGGKGSSGAVFQREAYCDLCQREFCNKYFLKTHKSNIHGIVDPNDPKSANTTSKTTHLQNSSTKLSNSPKLEPVQPVMPRILPPVQHAPVPKPLSNESMEDFCEICQKHFCNKYYLKKHKVDVHNIRPDGSRLSTLAADTVIENRNMPHIPAVSNAPVHPLPMMMPPLSNMNPTSMNSMLFVNPFVPMVPPMLQPPFFLPSMPNLAAAQAATQAMSSASPSIKAESKVLRISTNLERGESLPDSDVKAEGFCDICRKEFCNSYFLQIHRANKHGIFDEATASAAYMMSMAGAADQKEQVDGALTKGSASPASLTTSNAIRPVVLKSDKDRLQTPPAFSLSNAFSLSSAKYDSPASMPTTLSFDAMLAAKQADRIMCDICNKEVCNKYFLKAHKLKMHGITSPMEDRRTTSSADVKGDATTLQPPLPMLTMPEQPPLPSLQPISAQPAPADSTLVEHSSLIKLGIDPEAYCSLCKKEFCSKYFLKTHKLNMHGVKTDIEHRVTPRGTITPPTSVSPASATSPAQSVPVVPGPETFQWKWKENRGKTKNNFPPANESTALGSDQFSWRWREPANATRVFCDICNKELCNKYFLRTHKLKMHGISESNDQAMQASSIMADLARVSQNKGMVSPKGSINVNGFNSQRASPNQSQSSSPTQLEQQAAMREDICQVCGMVFVDVTAVDEHIRVEHGDEIFETPKSSTSEGKSGEKVFECGQCSYKTSVWQKLKSHETHKHNSAMNTCSSCRVTFSHVHMLVKHMRDIHNKDVTLASLELAAQQNTRSETPSIKTGVRSTQNRNTSRLKGASNGSTMKFHRRGEKAIRSSLLRSRVYACDKCKYTSSTMRNLRFHQAMKHKSKTTLNTRNQLNGSSSAADVIMQQFDIDSFAGTEFVAKEPVMLPVYHRVMEDVRINVTLTPSRLSSNTRAC